MKWKNAIIESVSIDDMDRGCMLTAWMFLKFQGSGQGFGGHVLYLDSTCKHHNVVSFAGHFIFRCMQIGGVTRWQDLPGKTVRVDATHNKVKGIGHIIEDDWFYPEKEFGLEDDNGE